jgi:hypothetical protein
VPQRLKGTGFRVCLKTGKKENSRSLHYAPPDFLWTLVALANFMRLSLQKAAHAVVAWSRVQEIRVRFGRDDNFVIASKGLNGNPSYSLHKIVISTGAQRSGETCGCSFGVI